jgi:hypothetical protein
MRSEIRVVPRIEGGVFQRRPEVQRKAGRPRVGSEVIGVHVDAKDAQACLTGPANSHNLRGHPALERQSRASAARVRRARVGPPFPLAMCLLETITGSGQRIELRLRLL